MLGSMVGQGQRVFLSRELSLNIVQHDLDPDFVKSFGVQLGWRYRDLYRELRDREGVTDEYREEMFNKARGDVATQVLAAAAKQHGIPLEFLRLTCNGQRKAVAKCGRLVLILEGVTHIEAHPQVADYKLSLSDMHSYMRQLELDLGDQPKRIRNWSGTALGVLLHGASGPRFTEQSKNLGILNLGLPDAAYRQWIARIDLQKTAMYGEGYRSTSRAPQPAASDSTQTDEVKVTPKRKNRSRGVA